MFRILIRSAFSLPSLSVAPQPEAVAVAPVNIMLVVAGRQRGAIPVLSFLWLKGSLLFRVIIAIS